jgi:hypothetical protein
MCTGTVADPGFFCVYGFFGGRYWCERVRRGGAFVPLACSGVARSLPPLWSARVCPVLDGGARFFEMRFFEILVDARRAIG